MSVPEPEWILGNAHIYVRMCDKQSVILERIVHIYVHVYYICTSVFMRLFNKTIDPQYVAEDDTRGEDVQKYMCTVCF